MFDGDAFYITSLLSDLRPCKLLKVPVAAAASKCFESLKVGVF